MAPPFNKRSRGGGVIPGPPRPGPWCGAVASHHGDITAAFNVAFWWSVGFVGLAALLSFWLPIRLGKAAKRTPAERPVAGSAAVSPAGPAQAVLQ